MGECMHFLFVKFVEGISLEIPCCDYSMILLVFFVNSVKLHSAIMLEVSSIN